MPRKSAAPVTDTMPIDPKEPGATDPGLRAARILYSRLEGEDATGGDDETLSQRVFVTLRDEILSGKLAPGTRLVRRAVAKRLNVSTLPVVEALLRLEADGLVESEPHVGARVSVFNIDSLRNDRVLREAIECQAARILAEQGAGTGLDLLMAKAELLDEMEDAAGEDRNTLDDRYMFAHFDFHVSVVEATGWPVLVSAMRGIWFRRIMVSIDENMELFRVPPNWHSQLVGALASGDPDRAESKMREHVRHSRDRFRDSLKETIKRDQVAWVRKIGKLTDKLP